MPPAMPSPDLLTAQGCAKQPMPPASKPKTWTGLLACPACRAGLVESVTELTCRKCGRRYPIEDGIPQLLLEDAISPSGVPGPGPAGRLAGQGPKG